MIFEHVFKSLVENTNDIIMVMDSTPFEDGGPFILYVNPAFENLLGYSADEIIGQNPRILQGSDTDETTRLKIREAMTNGVGIRTQILNYSKSGQPLWMDINIVPICDETNEISYYAAIERDLTEHKKLENHLERLASTDMLTGLPNRMAILNTAEKEFTRAKRYSRPFTVIMIDIDHFKSINDNYGHAAGDHVLVSTAQILKGNLRDTDVLGRVGGEEFILLLPDTPKTNAEYVAERMREGLSAKAIKYVDQNIHVTASFGIASFMPDDDTLEQIIERADKAMYAAKNNGRNQVQTAA